MCMRADRGQSRVRRAPRLRSLPCLLLSIPLPRLRGKVGRGLPPQARSKRLPPLQLSPASGGEGASALPASHATALRIERVRIFALVATLAMLAAPTVAHAQGYPTTFDFGTPATPQDIAAVAIAVGIDGKG